MDELKLSDDEDMFPPGPRSSRNVLETLGHRSIRPRNSGKLPPPPTTSLDEFAEDKLIERAGRHGENYEELQCELKPPTRSTFLIVFSPDRSLIATSHGDHNIYISNAKTGKLVKTLIGHPRTPWCIEFHPTRRDLLASGCLSGEVRVWDLEGFSEVWTTKCVIASIAFHPVNRILVIATYNEIHFWDWTQASPLVTVRTKEKDERVRYVKFDKLGHQLITGVSNVDQSRNQASSHERPMRSRRNGVPYDDDDDSEVRPSPPERNTADDSVTLWGTGDIGHRLGRGGGVVRRQATFNLNEELGGSSGDGSRGDGPGGSTGGSGGSRPSGPSDGGAAGPSGLRRLSRLGSGSSLNHASYSSDDRGRDTLARGFGSGGWRYFRGGSQSRWLDDRHITLRIPRPIDRWSDFPSRAPRMPGDRSHSDRNNRNRTLVSAQMNFTSDLLDNLSSGDARPTGSTDAATSASSRDRTSRRRQLMPPRHDRNVEYNPWRPNMANFIPESERLTESEALELANAAASVTARISQRYELSRRGRSTSRRHRNWRPCPMVAHFGGENSNFPAHIIEIPNRAVSLNSQSVQTDPPTERSSQQDTVSEIGALPGSSRRTVVETATDLSTTTRAAQISTESAAGVATSLPPPVSREPPHSHSDYRNRINMLNIVRPPERNQDLAQVLESVDGMRGISVFEGLDAPLSGIGEGDGSERRPREEGARPLNRLPISIPRSISGSQMDETDDARDSPADGQSSEHVQRVTLSVTEGRSITSHSISQTSSGAERNREFDQLVRTGLEREGSSRDRFMREINRTERRSMALVMANRLNLAFDEIEGTDRFSRFNRQRLNRGPQLDVDDMRRRRDEMLQFAHNLWINDRSRSRRSTNPLLSSSITRSRSPSREQTPATAGVDRQPGPRQPAAAGTREGDAANMETQCPHHPASPRIRLDVADSLAATAAVTMAGESGAFGGNESREDDSGGQQSDRMLEEPPNGDAAGAASTSGQSGLTSGAMAAESGESPMLAASSLFLSPRRCASVNIMPTSSSRISPTPPSRLSTDEAPQRGDEGRGLLSCPAAVGRAFSPDPPPNSTSAARGVVRSSVTSGGFTRTQVGLNLSTANSPTPVIRPRPHRGRRSTADAGLMSGSYGGASLTERLNATTALLDSLVASNVSIMSSSSPSARLRTLSGATSVTTNTTNTTTTVAASVSSLGGSLPPLPGAAVGGGVGTGGTSPAVSLSFGGGNPFTSRPPSSASEIEIELSSNQNSTVSSPIPRPLTARGRYSVDVDPPGGRSSVDSIRRSFSSDFAAHGHSEVSGAPPQPPSTPGDVIAVMGAVHETEDELGFASDSSSSRPGSRLTNSGVLTTGSNQLGGGSLEGRLRNLQLTRVYDRSLGVAVTRVNLQPLAEEGTTSRASGSADTEPLTAGSTQSQITWPGRSPRSTIGDSDSTLEALEDSEVTSGPEDNTNNLNRYLEVAQNRISQNSDNDPYVVRLRDGDFLVFPEAGTSGAERSSGRPAGEELEIATGLPSLETTEEQGTVTPLPIPEDVDVVVTPVPGLEATEESEIDTPLPTLEEGASDQPDAAITPTPRQDIAITPTSGLDVAITPTPGQDISAATSQSPDPDAPTFEQDVCQSANPDLASSSGQDALDAAVTNSESSQEAVSTPRLPGALFLNDAMAEASLIHNSEEAGADDIELPSSPTNEQQEEEELLQGIHGFGPVRCYELAPEDPDAAIAVASNDGEPSEVVSSPSGEAAEGTMDVGEQTQSSISGPALDSPNADESVDPPVPGQANVHQQEEQVELQAVTGHQVTATGQPSSSVLMRQEVCHDNLILDLEQQNVTATVAQTSTTSEPPSGQSEASTLNQNSETNNQSSQEPTVEASRPLDLTNGTSRTQDDSQQSSGTSLSAQQRHALRNQSLEFSMLTRHIEHMQRICRASLEVLPHSRHRRRQVLRLQGIRRMLEDLHRQIRQLQLTMWNEELQQAEELPRPEAGSGASTSNDSTSGQSTAITTTAPSTSQSTRSGDAALGFGQFRNPDAAAASPAVGPAGDAGDPAANLRHSLSVGGGGAFAPMRSRRRQASDLGRHRTPSSVLSNRSRLTRAHSQLVSRLHATFRAMEMSPDLSRRGISPVNDSITEASRSVLETHQRNEGDGQRQQVESTRRRLYEHLNRRRRSLFNLGNVSGGPCATESNVAPQAATSNTSNGSANQEQSVAATSIAERARSELSAMSQRLERLLRERRELNDAVQRQSLRVRSAEYLGLTNNTNSQRPQPSTSGRYSRHHRTESNFFGDEDSSSQSESEEEESSRPARSSFFPEPAVHPASPRVLEEDRQRREAASRRSRRLLSPLRRHFLVYTPPSYTNAPSSTRGMPQLNIEDAFAENNMMDSQYRDLSPPGPPIIPSDPHLATLRERISRRYRNAVEEYRSQESTRGLPPLRDIIWRRLRRGNTSDSSDAFGLDWPDNEDEVPPRPPPPVGRPDFGAMSSEDFRQHLRMQTYGAYSPNTDDQGRRRRVDDDSPWHNRWELIREYNWRGQLSFSGVTHRIQTWDYWQTPIPEIYLPDKNIVVREAKIHNDASVDISEDGSMLVALVPKVQPYTFNSGLVGLYSLRKENRGQELASYSLESCAVSVSLSPTSRYLMIGLTFRNSRHHQSQTDRNLMAQVYKVQLPKKNEAKGRLLHKKDLHHSNDTYFSLNCIRWIPMSGQGLVYGTNTGELKILR